MIHLRRFRTVRAEPFHDPGLDFLSWTPERSGGHPSVLFRKKWGRVGVNLRKNDSKIWEEILWPDQQTCNLLVILGERKPSSFLSRHNPDGKMVRSFPMKFIPCRWTADWKPRRGRAQLKSSRAREKRSNPGDLLSSTHLQFPTLEEAFPLKKWKLGNRNRMHKFNPSSEYTILCQMRIPIIQEGRFKGLLSPLYAYRLLNLISEQRQFYN